MILLPMIRENIPRLYEQQHNKTDIVYMKLNIEQSDWSWYILEYSKLQKMFYAYVLPEAEFQYVTIEYLEKLSYEYNVVIQEDLYFKKQSLKDLVNY